MGLEERAQNRDIDGVTYTVLPLPFGIGQKALIRTVKVLAPIMAATFRDGSTKPDLAGLMSALPSAITEEDLAWFSETFGKASFYADGDKQVPLLKVNQELHFAARYAAFFEWLWFSVEVNFGGFFSGLGKGNVGEILQAMPKMAGATP